MPAVNRWVGGFAATGIALLLASCGDQGPSTPEWERVGLHGGVAVSPAEIMAEVGCVPQVGAPDSGTVAIQTPTRQLLRFACGTVHPDSITRALTSVHRLLSSRCSLNPRRSSGRCGHETPCTNSLGAIRHTGGRLQE